MASIKPYKSGYRAFVFVGGKRESKIFATKREASAWASEREVYLRDLATKPLGEVFTLEAAMLRYAKEVSPTKRGARWEVLRINAMLASGHLPNNLPLGSVTPDHLGAWRDARLRVVSDNTVRREFGVLSAIFECARREWRWVAVNPNRDVRKPRPVDHREVVIKRTEIKAMLRGLGYAPGQPVRSLSQACAMCFMLALRTGMRAGEITGLTWANVHDGFCFLPVTKTVPRKVPLDIKATRIIDKMRGFDDVLVFGVAAPTLDARFRTIRKRVGLSGFTFHDARHTAATWLASSGKIDVLEMCKMFGWKDPKMAMVYFNPDVTSITDKLNKR